MSTDSDGTQDPEADSAPLDVRVVRGTPTDEELAAVLATLQAIASTAAPRARTKERALSEWERSIRDPGGPLPPSWR